MKIAILTDTHFGVRNDHTIFQQQNDLFLQNVFFPYVKDNAITTCWHLGDVFDRRKYVNFKTLYAAKLAFFQPAEQLGLTFDCTVGNHDTYAKNSNQVNSPQLLAAEYENFIVHTQAVEKQYDGTNVLLLPWICAENYEHSVDLIAKSKAPIAAGHLELQGFEMNRGRIADVGFDPAMFDKFDRVFSGHYHHKSTKDNIDYLGSTQQFTWADYNDQRGFHIFDTETRHLEFIINPYITFKKVVYDDTNQNAVSGDVQSVEDFEQLKGCFVRLQVNKKTDSYKFDVIQNSIEGSGVANLTVDDGSFLKFEDQEHQFDEIEDTMAVLQKYIRYSDTAVDKKRLEKFIGQLYNEALSLE